MAQYLIHMMFILTQNLQFLFQKETYLSLPLYRVVAPAKYTESHPDVLRRQKSRLDRVNSAIVSKTPACRSVAPQYNVI